MLTFNKLVKQKDRDDINLSCLALAVVTPTPHTVSNATQTALQLSAFGLVQAHTSTWPSTHTCTTCLDHPPSSALTDCLTGACSGRLLWTFFPRHQFRLSRGAPKTQNVTCYKERLLLKKKKWWKNVSVTFSVNQKFLKVCKWNGTKNDWIRF